MATVARNSLLLNHAISSAQPHSGARRRIGFNEGRALETLGHAIQYLSDGCNATDLAFSCETGRLEAISTLIALNREIYLACPEITRWSDRLQRLLHAPEVDTPAEPWDWPAPSARRSSRAH